MGINCSDSAKIYRKLYKNMLSRADNLYFTVIFRCNSSIHRASSHAQSSPFQTTLGTSNHFGHAPCTPSSRPQKLGAIITPHASLEFTAPAKKAHVSRAEAWCSAKTYSRRGNHRKRVTSREQGGARPHKQRSSSPNAAQQKTVRVR